jgi:hypothetical protein
MGPVPESNTPLWTEWHIATVMYCILLGIRIKDSSDLSKYVGREPDRHLQTKNMNYTKLYCKDSDYKMN